MAEIIAEGRGRCPPRRVNGVPTLEQLTPRDAGGTLLVHFAIASAPVQVGSRQPFTQASRWPGSAERETGIHRRSKHDADS